MTNDLTLVHTNTTRECWLLVMIYIALEEMGVGLASTAQMNPPYNYLRLLEIT